MGLLVPSPVAVERAIDESCTGCALSLLTGNYIGWYSQWPAQCFSGRDKKGAQVSWIWILCSSFTSFNNREVIFLVWSTGYPVHLSIQTHSFAMSPRFYCFSAKFMRFCFHWESSRKTKVAKYPFNVKAETSPLALVGQGTMDMTWKGQIPRGLCRGLFTWSIIH